MKFSTTLLLPAVVSAAVLDTRQLTGLSSLSSAMKSNYTYSSKTLTATMRSNSKKQQTRIGPIQLLAGASADKRGGNGLSMDRNGQGAFIVIPKGTFCDGGDCTILSGHVGLTFEDGTVADVSKKVYTHHILGTNLKKKIDIFVNRCDTDGDLSTIQKPSSSTAQFIGVSDDNGNAPITYGTTGALEGGYWLSKDQSILASLDMVNLDEQPKQVYLTYEIESLPGHVGADAQGSLTSVTGCQAKTIAAGMEGPANTTSRKFKIFRDGYLVNGKGHLHDGGEGMDMFINGKYACTSEAVYGGEGSTTTTASGKKWETISAMTMCPGPIKVKEGDYMSLTARYDSVKHPGRETGSHGMAEIMGMWAMNFIPEAGSAPPTAA